MNPVLAIDIGATNIKAILLNQEGMLLNDAAVALEPYHPHHGLVEYQPEELFKKVLFVIDRLLTKEGLLKSQLSAIGICNTKGTTILWDKETKKPIWNAIAYIDERQHNMLKEYKSSQNLIKEKTGRFLNTHSAVLKIKWILEKTKADPKNILCGCLNTWILWKLTDGKVHCSDMTNAGASFLYNIHTQKWDDDLITLFNIPKNILPEVKSNSEVYGYTDPTIFGGKIPIASMIGKNQAALFGSGCVNPGDTHCLLGSSSFFQTHTGNTCIQENKHVSCSIALSLKGKPLSYSLEGSLYSSGGVINWLKDHLGIIRSINEIEGLAHSVPDSLGVFFIPALNGIGFTHEKEGARGSFLGLSCNTNIGHICRAALEGIALMIAELSDHMKQDTIDYKPPIKCSGAMSENNFLMQMISDVLQTDLIRPQNIEMACIGTAFLAGLAVGVWKDEKELFSHYKKERLFKPELPEKDQSAMKKDFKRALKATLDFSEIDLA